MDLLGVKISAPRLPSLGSVRDTVQQGVRHAREFGDAAVVRARDLGRQGADFGRRAVRDPEGTVRSLAASARETVDRGTQAAQTGVRDAVMFTGRQVGRGAQAARDAVPGDNLASRLVRNSITGAEQRARFTVGVVGGVVNEGVGLVGTVGSLGVTAAELQASPTARAELGRSIASAASQGGRAISGYAHAVAADPSRVVSDARDGARAGLNAAGDFVEGQVRRHGEAFRRGEGFETLGMTAGQVATYVVPVGAGGRAAATGARGLEAAATGARIVAREAGEGLVATGARSSIRETGEAAARSLDAGVQVPLAASAPAPAVRQTAEAAGTARLAEKGATVGEARAETALQTYWPPNRGFQGTPVTEKLAAGTRIDRYGYEGGTFLSPEGTPDWMRSLAPGTTAKPYNIYEVAQPIEVQSGKAAPWFNQVGGGVQYELPMSVSDALAAGSLRRVGP